MQDFSNRLHNNLVIKASHKKVLSTAMSTQSNRKVHPARDADIFNALQSKSDSLHLRPRQMSDMPTVLAETNTLDDVIIVNSLTPMGPYMAHRFSWALFKVNS